MEGKLTRSKSDRMLAGVLGGVAAYFNIDATLLRIIFVILTIPVTPLILVYFAAIFIMPNERRMDE
ncbi:Phage shock protein PspC (stress-responsive transcriptional regulator) [Thalassobacillus cyri]|uniref:Phage shock protein PspC (Stress-responsive transcriptional regulator) n=1 Tax=Thalassobacillus cyri TaxID=571932 RepID=A0A1H4AZZ9_9BACI|nr:PspC domain-containing protein [Thalassobacillus cyri]SEA41440.1 Phage shock protein PspC (stress-responsive transcriptional regulator) [Thalassobacillus cyri]